MKIKKIITIVILVCLMAAVCLTAGCSDDAPLVFTVSGEDTIVITFDAAELVDMEMSDTDPHAFIIKRNDKTMIQGRIVDDTYALQVEMAFTADPATRQLTERLYNGNPYTLWCTADTEWSYICHIADTNMAMLMSGIDQDFTTACFESMTFSQTEAQ